MTVKCLLTGIFSVQWTRKGFFEFVFGLFIFGFILRVRVDVGFGHRVLVLT